MPALLLSRRTTMAVATGEIYQCTYQYEVHGSICENVIHMRERTGLSTPAQIETSSLGFWTSVKPLISNAVTLVQVIVKRMTPTALDQQFAEPPDGTQTGTSSGGTNNNSVALVITLRTGTAGKTHRGRIYVPGLSVSHVDTQFNRLSTSGLTAAVDACDDVMALFDDATGSDEHLALGIYSRTIGGDSPFTLAGWQAVSQMVPRSVLGNQRRRRPGIGM